ncbi:MAG: hypothetical protein JXK05_02640 [Campylobacterales bacterium]|nr:hypothetical protein [Campylobacterales bacterium]
MRMVVSLYFSIVLVSFAQAGFLKKEQLAHLKTDFGVVQCWEQGNKKYVVIDIAGDQYAVNGTARAHAKKYPRLNWKDAELLLKDGGNHIIFSEIIQDSIKEGCSRYMGL